MTEKGVWKNKGTKFFKNGAAIHRFLAAQGWKVSHTKVYTDIRLGILVPDKDNWFSEDCIMQYALNYLHKDGNIENIPATKTSEVVKDLDSLTKQKLQLEVELKQAQRDKLRFDLERKQGMFIPRGEVDSLLAARWVILRSGFQAMIDLNLDIWCDMIKDDPVQGQSVMRESILNEFWLLLNEFATAAEIEVVPGEED